MKKAAIITIIDQENIGNRLQNYAVQEVLKRYNFQATTINNTPILNKSDKYTLRLLKYYITAKKINKGHNKKRKSNFEQFNEKINMSKKIFNLRNIKNFEQFDYFLVGSDQIWNPYFGRLEKFDLVDFSNSKNKIGFSASFGVSDIPEEYKERTKKALQKFKAISVREDAGKQIVTNITHRTDVEVLVDPTMLLGADEWDKVAIKPKYLNNEKYILNYFLGEVSEKRKKEIDRIAKENNCQVINILDKNDKFYECGPSEFLYLEKNAFLICTDSFHSSVFAIIYNRPFIVFDREDNVVNMNSRIETLLEKFKLKNRKYKEKITAENLFHDYTNAYKILKEERDKADTFLKNSFEEKKIEK